MIGYESLCAMYAYDSTVLSGSNHMNNPSRFEIVKTNFVIIWIQLGLILLVLVPHFIDPHMTRVAYDETTICTCTPIESGKSMYFQHGSCGKNCGVVDFHTKFFRVFSSPPIPVVYKYYERRRRWLEIHIINMRSHKYILLDEN
jgi:hypothetical protein